LNEDKDKGLRTVAAEAGREQGMFLISQFSENLLADRCRRKEEKV
jgi:hypothetical protein